MAAAQGQPFGPVTVTRIAASSLSRVSAHTPSLFLALRVTVTGAACLDSTNRPTQFTGHAFLQPGARCRVARPPVEPSLCERYWSPAPRAAPARPRLPP